MPHTKGYVKITRTWRDIAKAKAIGYGDHNLNIFISVGSRKIGREYNQAGVQKGEETIEIKENVEGTRNKDSHCIS